MVQPKKKKKKLNTDGGKLNEAIKQVMLGEQLGGAGGDWAVSSGDVLTEGLRRGDS